MVSEICVAFYELGGMGLTSGGSQSALPIVSNIWNNEKVPINNA